MDKQSSRSRHEVGQRSGAVAGETRVWRRVREIRTRTRLIPILCKISLSFVFKLKFLFLNFALFISRECVCYFERVLVLADATFFGGSSGIGKEERS